MTGYTKSRDEIARLYAKAQALWKFDRVMPWLQIRANRLSNLQRFSNYANAQASANQKDPFRVLDRNNVYKQQQQNDTALNQQWWDAYNNWELVWNNKNSFKFPSSNGL